MLLDTQGLTTGCLGPGSFHSNGGYVVLLCAQVKGAKMRVRGYGIALGHPRKHLPSSTEIKLSLRLYCECKIIIIALFAGVGVRDMLLEVCQRW